MERKKRRLLSRTIILILLGAALVFALYTNFTKDKNETLKKGSEAPNFVLSDMEGINHKLSDYEGEGVFLNFWGTYCEPCEYEMPYMDSQYQKYKNQGVEVLAINVGESTYAVNNYVSKHKLTFPVLIDKGKEVENAYNVDVLPVSFLINKEGEVVDIITGALTEESIQKHMERIKP